MSLLEQFHRRKLEVQKILRMHINKIEDNMKEKYKTFKISLKTPIKNSGEK